jgi:PAS domain S-box-containing protein
MVSPVAESLPKGSIASTKKTSIHVLHVDDDAGYLKTAKMILEMQGSFHVETASSVEEAMEKIEEKTFDVIVCDYIMPGKDGLEFLKELRDSGNTIPFIIFTGKGREIVAIRALNLGADQYVNKIGKPEAVYSELAHGICTVVKGKKAEEVLRDSEKEKSAVLDSMSELVIHQDLKHRILWVNRKAADSVNIKAEQLKGRYCHELWAESANPCAGCPIEESIKTGQPQQGEMTTPDGRVWSISGYPIKDANGNVTNVVEVVTNITEQKKAEEELRKSEAKYRGLVENIGNGIATTDLEGRFVFVNQALCEMIGYSEKELIGKPFADFLHPEDKKKILQIFLDSWKNPSRKLSIEFRVIHKKGHIVHMYSSPTATLYKNKIVGFNAILSDITKRKLAEKALQESEEKYRNVVEQAPDSIMTFDLNGVVTSCNAASVAMSGYSRDEVVGKHFSELRSLNEENIQKFLKLLPSLLEGKMPEPFEIVYLKENGTSAFGEVHISLMKEGERITGFQAIMRDITEQKKAAEALEKSEERYRAIVELSPDGILTANLKGTVTSVNKAFLDLTGFSEDEIVGKHFSKLGTLRARDLPKYMKLFASFLRGKLPSIYEFVYLHKDGSRRCGDARFSFIKKNGKTVGFQAVLRDTTERKLLAEQLKESEQKYRKQFEEELDAIFVADAETGILIDCNRAATKLVGRKKSELVGKHQRILHPSAEINGEFSRTYKQHLKEKEGQVLETQVITKTGEIRDVAIKANIFELGNKKIMQAEFRDITEQKKAEEALRKSEKSWSDSFSSLEDVMVIIGKDFTIEKMNDIGLKLLGKTREEVTGKKCYQAIHCLDAPCEFCPYERTLKTGKLESVERYIELFDKYFSIKSSPIFNERGEIVGFVDLMRDVTERKKAEEALRESEEKYRELLNGMNDTAWVIDFDGKFVDVNDAAVRVLGYSREELLSMGPPNIDTSLTAEEIRDLIKGMPADKIQVFETAHTTKDGKTIPVEISSSLVTYRGKQAILSIARDITERKKAEQKLNEMMNELVTINEKLGVVGRLTRHDARNKLSVIANNVYLAKQKLAANHSSLNYLGDIESAVDQMEEIFDFARTYEMLGVEELSYMNLEKSVDEAAILFSVMNGVKLVNECQDLTALADSLLRQLFYNLIDDTLKHGEKVSQIRVYYEEGEDQLKLIYEDDGVGIPNDEKEKIFKEGYGKGTGYGLYLIKKICEAYGWTIQETGVPGKGAQFTITIPKTNKNGKISYIIN